MNTYTGDAEITEDNQSLFKDVQKITGDVRLYGSAKLDALTEVGGDVEGAV